MDFLLRFIADYSVFIAVIVGAYALLRYVPNTSKFAAYSRVLMAGLTAYLLAQLIATVYQPADLRPFQELGVDPGAAFLDNPGFPSDHVLFVAAITLAVWFETRKKVLTLILATILVLVSVGRVVALVHSPLDVIGGLVIAALGAVWYLQYTRESKAVGGRRPASKTRRKT